MIIKIAKINEFKIYDHITNLNIILNITYSNCNTK